MEVELTGFGDFQIGNIVVVSRPTIQATNVTFTGVSATGMTIGWTNGDGNNRIVLVKLGSAVDGFPVDRNTYNASTVFGSGAQIGTGNYVVYNGTGNSVTITGLSPSTIYHIAVVEFNGPSGHELYLTTNPATGSRQSAATGPYRTFTSGNWNNPGTWEFFDGSVWSAATSTPASVDDQITIQNGHTVTVTADLTVDQVTVALGAQVTVSSGVSLIITDDVDDPYDFIVDGTLNNTGTVTATGALTVNSGGRYIHSTSGTVLPIATWNTGSTCEVTGWTTVVALTPSFDQTFYNFIWNCPGQSTNVSFAGYVHTVNGTFTLANSGNNGYTRINPAGNPTYGYYLQTGGTYNLADVGEVAVMTIPNDFTIYSGQFFGSENGQGTINIGGDFLMTSGSLNQCGVDGYTSVVNIAGNFTMTGGVYYLSRYEADGFINVAGNFTLSGGGLLVLTTRRRGFGTLTVGGNFTQYSGEIQTEANIDPPYDLQEGAIVFNGNGMQTYSSGGFMNGIVHFTVNNGAYLQMSEPGTIIPSTNAGSFTLLGGGTLGITSPVGITSSGATGNIQMTGTRTFSTGANYIYNGVTAQETGSGLPATINSLVFNNTGGNVTFTAASTVTNSFSVTAGSRANLGTYSHTAGTLALAGVVQPGCTFGSSASAASYKNDTFFASAGTGTVTTGACAAGQWLGGSSSSWNNTANWFNNSLPTLSTNVIIASAAPNQPAVNISTAECNALTISSGATLGIGAGQALTVHGNLTNSGTLTIESTSVTSNGSLIVEGTSTGTVRYNRVMPGSLYRYVSSPVGSTTLPAGEFWYWNEPDASWVPTTACASGLGYTMLASSNTVSYTGTIVSSASQTGSAPYSSSSKPNLEGRALWGGGGWNLMGNPFTSAMNGLSFISTNSASIDASYQALYIYDGSGYTYVAESVPGFPTGVGAFPYTDIQVGQGFFVLANYNNVPFSFEPTMRVHHTEVPMTKSAGGNDNSWPGIQLKVKYGEKESSTLVVYNEKMTVGLDAGYDVGQFSAGLDVEIYTTLVEKDNDVNFTRQALPIADSDKNIVPVGIDSKNGGEVTFSAYAVPIDNMKFLLEDRKTGIFTDLSTKSYKVTLPAETYGSGRFFIIASTNTPTAIENPQANDNGVRIWISNDELIIKGDVSEKARCEIYNVSGQKIVDILLTGGELNTVTLPENLKGILIVKVIDGMKLTTRKVALL